ncbi:MAG: hypothetical protein U5K70_06455 [Halodesulfurarchaeum sp.]|nr:hypothetical protein [Halodesulfurarchaeum sp.]
MPWGVHSEYTDDGGPDVEIDEEQEDVERGEEGKERTESFDVADALSRLE